MHHGSADYELPEGRGASLWVSSDLDYSPWCFIWAEFEARKAPPAWYRVYPAGTAPGEWKPMKPGAEVLEQSGFADDPEILSDPDDGGAQLGAAEKLPKGRYVLQAKILHQKKELELDPIAFRVK